MHKTISFDLWNTLIKPNPDFVKYRNIFIKKHSPLKTDEEINKVFKMFKADIDSSCETFGLQFNREELFEMLYKQLKMYTTFMRSDEFMKEYDKLFLTYQPELKEGAEKLLYYCSSKNYTTVLASNTVLIPGEILKRVLSELRILRCFNYTVFSDEIGVSKPNPKFFAHVQMKCKSYKRDIIHIGDSRTTDIDGAHAYGFKTIMVNDDLNTVPEKIEAVFNNRLEEILIDNNIFN